jgi:signal transduction histidine kinase
VSRRAVIARWTPRPLDLAIAGALLVAAGLEQWLGDIGGPRWVAVLFGAIGAIAVAWRNLAPASVAWIAAIAATVPVFAGVPSDDGIVAVIPILLAMFALGQASERGGVTRRRAYPAIAGTLVLAMSTSWRQGIGGADALWVSAVVLAPYLFGRAVGASRKESEHHARRADRAIEEREASQTRAVADERLRIARELHDVISHSVSLMGVQAGAARTVLPAGLDDVEEMLRSIEGLGRDTLDEMRRLLGVMREGTAGEGDLAPQPGIAAIDELAARSRAAGVPVSLTIDPTVGGLSPGVDLIAYRIVQESLTNVRRHAPGATASVRIERRHGTLEVEVSNPTSLQVTGSPEAGHGIIGMRERAALYDASFSAGFEGRRFVVRSAIPIDASRGLGLAVVEG